MKIMMSSCITGKNVMYGGGNFFDQDFWDMVTSHPKVNIVHFCPEHIMLGTPRNNMLIHGGDGQSVWDGTARLLDTSGNDLTEVMKKGAQKMLEFAQREKPDCILLVDGSDSCGVNVLLDPENYTDVDGKRRHQFKPGSGVAATLLKENGFQLFSHMQTDEIKAFLTERLNGA